MMRSVGAVIAGYLVFGARSALLFGVSGKDPQLRPGAGFLIGSLISGAAFVVVGGWLAARLAPRKPMRHAGVLSAVIGLIALVSMILEWSAGSVWSELVPSRPRPPWAGGSGFVRTFPERGSSAIP
jgi:hypothetical protein